jgi:hypothetical protein
MSIIVIPTKNEYGNIYRLMNWFTKVEPKIKYKENKIGFLIIDDSEIEEYNKIEKYLSMYKWARCIRGDNGYRNSVLLGIISSLEYNPNSIIIMDADHPHEIIFEMIESLKNNDVVVGVDATDNLQRIVTSYFCNNLLRMDLDHPTCGFWGFNVKVITSIKPWKVKSSYDFSHVEWLLSARREGLTIGEVPFISYVKHGYNVKRYLRWLYDFIRVMFI